MPRKKKKTLPKGIFPKGRAKNLPEAGRTTKSGKLLKGRKRG